jgi:tRNA A37 threonylcarbamoyladenosine biosynthesis protein TsaE
MIWQTSSIGPADTEKLGELLGKILDSNEVIELSSDLGGGKTTFTRGLARGLGSKDTVSSPTYTIVQRYKIHPESSRLSEVQGAGEQRTEPYRDSTAKEQPQPATQQFAKSTSSAASSAGGQASAAEEFWLHHFDFYRLNEAGIVADELAESLHDKNVITVVEWSDVVQDVLPKDRLTIEFKAVADDPEEREIVIKYLEAKQGIIKTLETAWEGTSA